MAEGTAEDVITGEAGRDPAPPRSPIDAPDHPFGGLAERPPGGSDGVVDAARQLDTPLELIATRVVIGRRTRGYRVSLYRSPAGFGLSAQRDRIRLRLGTLLIDAVRR